MRTTYTYVTMEISQAAYDEIHSKMKAADYGHAIDKDGTIDMHGLALIRSETQVETTMLDMDALQRLRKASA
jgi:hypothetical protein